MTRTYTKAELDAAVAAALEEAAKRMEGKTLIPDKDVSSLTVFSVPEDGAEKVRALIPDAGAALDRALDAARTAGRQEEREACYEIAKSMVDHTIRHHPSAVEACNKVAAAICARADHGEKK